MITLILQSRNEGDNARRFVQYFKNQTKKPDEVILIDSSDDNTREILKPIVDRIIITKPRGTSYARADGVKACHSDIIVWTDIDCELDERWFEELVKPFEDKNVMVVQGSIRTHSLNGKEKGMFVNPPIKGKYLNTCNAAVRKAVMDEIPIDPWVLWEDIEMGYRISKKYTITGCPKSRVFHYGLNKNFEKTQRNLKNNAQWAGKGWARILKKHKNIYWFVRIYYNIFNVIPAHGFKTFLYYIYYFNKNLFFESEEKSEGRKVL
jgi:glycosyltransferase involved in cell wall biosynthesis